MAKLRGRRMRSEFSPVDLGLGRIRQLEIERRVELIIVRWQPMTDDPNGLRRDLYRLLIQVVDDPFPNCPLLEHQPAGCL